MLPYLEVRQVWMKIQCWDVLEEAQLVEVPERGQRRDLLRTVDERRTQSVGIVDRHIKRLHQRAGILSEALLARHEGVAV